MTASRPAFVHALAKGLEILSAFAEGELLGNQQLVERTGLPKATVSRLTSTLVDLGYLRLDAASRRYAVGTRLLGLGASVQRRIGLFGVARPHMQALSREIGLTVSLGTRDRLGITVLEVQRPPALTRLVTNIDVGTVLPLPTTAMGLAWLAAAPAAERAQVLAGLARRDPAAWPQWREAVERAVGELARQGFVTTQRSWGRDVNGVGVPLLLRERRALYAFHCAGPSARMPGTLMRRELGPRLLAMVGEVQQAMLEIALPRVLPPERHDPGPDTA
jgi:DNA-binding IclR family transcriptional regulator